MYPHGGDGRRSRSGQNVTEAWFEHTVVLYSHTRYVIVPPLVETTSVKDPEFAAAPNETPLR